MSGATYWWQQMIGRWCCLDCWTYQQFLTASITLCCWNVCGLLWVSPIQSLTGCDHFWPTECSRLPTAVRYLSSVQSVLLGVPQGSVLGPLLYVLYTAELVLVVDRLHQYADDTQVYISTPASDAEAAVRRLSACLVDIEAWLRASQLRLNPTKTQVMWLGSPQQLAKVKCFGGSGDIGRYQCLGDGAYWRCLRRRPLCVAVAITSYGSSDRSSDRCHLMQSRHWSRHLFHVTWTTVTHFSTASRMV